MLISGVISGGGRFRSSWKCSLQLSSCWASCVRSFPCLFFSGRLMVLFLPASCLVILYRSFMFLWLLLLLCMLAYQHISSCLSLPSSSLPCSCVGVLASIFLSLSYLVPYCTCSLGPSSPLCLARCHLQFSLFFHLFCSLEPVHMFQLWPYCIFPAVTQQLLFLYLKSVFSVSPAFCLTWGPLVFWCQIFSVPFHRDI